MPSEKYQFDGVLPDDAVTEDDCESPLLTSWRLMTTVLVMVGTMQMMLGRTSLSMALVCMVGPSPGHGPDPSGAWDSHTTLDSFNTTNTGLSHSPQASASMDLLAEDFNSSIHQVRVDYFNWSKTIQGHLLSSYFYGYTLGMLLGGWASDRWGGRLIMLLSLGINAGTNLLLPAAAYAHHGALLAIRVIQGLSEGLGLNTHPYLLARWGTQRDLSLLSSIIYTGFSLGVMVAHPLISTLCLYGPFGGWPSSFYLLGLLSSCLALIAAVLLHNSPITHPFISEAELRYFRHYGKALDPKEESRPAPLGRLFKSVPVYALLVTSIFSSFGYLIFSLHQPLFMRDTFGFSIDQNGLMSSLPWALELPVSPAVGFMVDTLKRKQMRVTKIKKIFNTLGLILSGLTPMLVVEAPYEWRWAAATTLLFVVVGNCMLFVGGYYYTPIDLAPSCAATLSGMTNIFAGLNGLLAPIVVAHMTPTGSRNEWRQVFWVSGVMHLLGIFTFLIWGSAETLPWAATTNIHSKRTSLQDLDGIKESSANMLTYNDQKVKEDKASDIE